MGGRQQLHAGARRAAGALAGSLVLSTALARAAAATPSGAGWEAGHAALHPRLRLPQFADGSRENSFRLAPPRALRPLEEVPPPASTAGVPAPPSALRDGAAPGPEGRAAFGGLGGARVTFDLRLRDAPAAGVASSDTAAGLLEGTAGPAGVRRLQFGVDGLSLGGRERLQASWLSLTGSDSRQSARRFAFRTEGSRLTLDGLFQESAGGLRDDRALSAEDRALMGDGWGSRVRSLNAGYRLTPWLSAEGLWSSARSLVEERDRRRMRQQWVLTPTRGAKLTWLRDATTLRTGGHAAATIAQTLKLEQKLPSLTLTAALDTARAGAGEDTRRLSLHLASAAGRPATGSLDYRRQRDERGRGEESGHLELATPLRALAALRLDGTRRSDGDHGEARITGEARGWLSARLPWRATLLQSRSDRDPGRRDLTFVIDPPATAADRPPSPRLLLSVARSQVIAPRSAADRAAPLPSLTQAVLLMREQPLGSTVVGLGLTGLASPGNRRWGIAYDLRSDARRPLQLQISRRLVETGKVTAPLLRREAVAFHPPAGWQLSLAREHLTAVCATGLAEGEDRWLFEVGRRTRRLQWSAGGGHQLGPDGRRAGLAARCRLEGDVAPGAHLRLAYDRYAGLPGPNRLRESVAWSYQQRLGSDLAVDLQGTWQRLDGASEPELTWHLDAKVAF